tara:strand:- start:1784 stop:2482 length:699 start_codon:yes stop_codon:yes gene_type:complete
MDKKTITLLLPTLNEVVGFKAIFPKIDTNLFDEILVIDGGSTDGTVEYARSQNLNLVIQKEKGLGPAVMEAISLIKTDCVIEFSLDGNCMVEQLEEIVNNLHKGYDLVVVSRYLPPAVSYDDNMTTAIGNKMFTFFIGFLGKFNPTDTLTIYRGFDIKIPKYPEFIQFLYGPVFEPLISAVALNRQLSIIEIPGDEPARIGGTSKMSVIYNGLCIVLMIIRMYIFKILKIKI